MNKNRISNAVEEAYDASLVVPESCKIPDFKKKKSVYTLHRAEGSGSQFNHKSQMR